MVKWRNPEVREGVCVRGRERETTMTEKSHMRMPFG
jgi:hypothetical protein